jgi:sugar fermentation stimulation protein A
VITAQLPAGAGRHAGTFVYLDTGKTNAVARTLITHQLVPALSSYEIERAEVPVGDGHSRIDFLLRSRAEVDAPVRYLEVKSCTLFNGAFAMFPDAVTDRGRRHVRALAAAGGCAVLLVVHTDRVALFSPDFHCDLAFAGTMYELRKRVPLILVGVAWEEDGTIRNVRTDMRVPWHAIAPHIGDRGSYLILLRVPKSQSIPVGALGPIVFKAGYYLYVGSAQNGVSARVNRHRRRGRKNLHWHIDYLREAAEWVDAFPIREPDRRECEIAGAYSRLADGVVPGFGTGDCTCDSHLSYWRSDPRRNPSFQAELLHQRRVTLEARVGDSPEGLR